MKRHMAADSDTDGPGTAIRQIGLQKINFYQIVHNYYAVPIYIMKSCFLGLCVPHTCSVRLAPMILPNDFIKTFNIMISLPAMSCEIGSSLAEGSGQGEVGGFTCMVKKAQPCLGSAIERPWLAHRE